MSTKKPQVYRVGDKVRVLEPEFFVRCGYPMEIAAEFEKFKKNYQEEIWEFLEKVNLVKRPTQIFQTLPQQIFQSIARESAYWSCKTNKFGGNERKIYTKRITEAKDQIFKVVSKSRVITGTYNRAYQGYEGEFEPPYLSNSKTHIILSIWSFNLGDELHHAYPFQIEAKNVQLVDDV